jgi:hypothetical protein
MVKHRVESDMPVTVFVPKDVCAKKIQDLMSFSLPERRGHRKANVVLRTVVAPKSEVKLVKKEKIMANNQAAISSQFPRTRAFSIILRKDHYSRAFLLS